jgi:putative ABC transport system permease protein
VFFVIIVQTHYDFSFDRNFEKADNIYMISKYLPHRDVRWINTNTRMSRDIAEKFPEIKNYCFLNNRNKPGYYFQDENGDKHEFEAITTRASVSIMDVFMPKVIMGDARQAFTEPNKAMITESMAKKFFGNQDPVSKTFTEQYSNTTITVVAVCEDFPDNCSLDNGIYIMQPDDVDSEWSYSSYIEISDGGKDKILNALNSDESFREQADDEGWVFELTALSDIHLKFPAKGKGSLSTTLSLLAIGILLLIIAYINFVNFSVSMAPIRLKSFNIRRIMGENDLFLKFSIAMEAVFISLIAVLVSMFFIYWFNVSVVKEFFQANISLPDNYGLFILMAALFLAMGFVAGIYPAVYSTAFKPAMAINGSFAFSTGGKMLKNTLIIIQFAAAIILVIVSGFIKTQHDYMQDKSWGIRKENVVYLDAWKLTDVLAFAAELRKNPDILDHTYTSTLPGASVMTTWGLKFEGVRVDMTVWPVYHNYLQFFGINLVEGRDFEPFDMMGPVKMIFNQTFVKKYGFTDLAGKEMTFHNQCEIIGVMEDFNFESLREPVRPIALVVGQRYLFGMRTMLVKINGQNTVKALDYMQGLCKQFSNEPIEITFLDDMLHQLYKQENNLAKLISIFGLITIIVTIMGVYGLILFNVKSKRKTVAIHKINGASITDMIMMLNQGFVVRFAIAYLIAVPLSYLIVNRWLENFAYKTPLHLWIFLAGGLLVFVIMTLTVSYQSYKAATANPVDGIKV